MLYKRTVTYDYSMWVDEKPPNDTAVYYIGVGSHSLLGSSFLSDFIPINDEYSDHRNFNVVENHNMTTYYWYYLDDTYNDSKYHNPTFECKNVQDIVNIFYSECFK